MNILITGIHGFVGSNLAKTLHTRHALFGLDIVSPVKNGIIKTFSWADLENENLPKMDVIIHLAGKAHDTKNQSEAQVYFDINAGLTQKIYDYYLQATASKFIFFSSVKAVADSVKEDILTEDVIPEPRGPYGESKIKAEEYIQEKWPDKDSAKLVFILRPAMIHGPGNKGNLNLLYKLAQNGLPWPLGAFKNMRSFTSIDNLQFVIQQLIENEIKPGIYQIADDDSLSTNELIELIAASQGKKARIWKLNSKLISFAARVGDKLHLPLNSERLKKLTESYVVSNQKIKKALRIRKMPITATEGMKKTFKSLKK